MTDVNSLSLAAENPDTDDVRELVRHLDEDLAVRYPQHPLHGFHPKEIADGRGVFIVARVEGRAVGCGAVRPLAPGVGEIKRMFVEPAFRGRGIARRVLRHLETAARELGF